MRPARLTFVGLDPKGVSVRLGPTGKVRFRALWWYAALLWKRRPSLVHLHTPNTELVHYAAKRLYPLRLQLFRTLHSTALPTGLFAYATYRGNRAECSIACSDAVAAAHKQAVDGGLITIANGVAFERPPNDVSATEQCKAALGWNLQERHFLHIGRMSENSHRDPKAHGVLIGAWMKWKMGSRGFRLHLLGDGPGRHELQALAACDSSIQFHGIQSDMGTWLAAADCFVLPSRTEGLPLAGIEAIGSGLPCVFSDIAALRELVPPLAFWCKVDDEDDLGKMLALAGASQARPDRLEIERFRERFSIETVAERYIGKYMDVSG